MLTPFPTRQGDLSPFAVPFRACRAKTENRPVFKFQFIEQIALTGNGIFQMPGKRIATTSLRTGFAMTPLSVFCIYVNGERLCVSAYFLFNKTTKTHQNVIASQCSHWRGNLKMQGDVLCILKDPCQPKNIYYLRFPISFGNLNE